MTEYIKQLKNDVLFSIIEILPYEAFDINIISKACKNIGLQSEYANLLFPNGRAEFLEVFRDYIDEIMVEKIKNELSEVKSITSRISESLKIRFEILDKYKIIIPKIIAFYSMPRNHLKLYPYTWKSMNLIWRTAGNDKSTDFNYYTKRGLLTGVYWATLLYWLSDESTNYEGTHDFLNRKLILIGKVAKKIKLF
ncbi:COQ9 family protein [Candidatus Bandiella numerosa]|uniref:COQ9 family protein n=1 Tax=Candidatus Bandiella numerosa TaxID=2570586 RepID=UPI00249E60FE|nr:COQ9 family protein [Candidatus Bandiella numerosa]WHA05118.1 COQ9 family protein [Candidatus Bandiella numerosa]